MTRTILDQHRAQLSSLDTPGGRITYLDVGPRDGHPVVLVHGVPTSSFLYRHIAPALAGQGLRAIAPDLLGFGASDKPTDTTHYDLRAQSQRLVQLLDHLGLPAATWVAHDLGGPWTFEIADAFPERIRSLVVLNTSAYDELMTPPRGAWLVGGPFGGLFAATMGTRLGRPMVGKFLNDFIHRGTTLPAEVVAAYWTTLHEGGTRAFRAFARNIDAMMGEFDRYALALKRLDVPATVIWGSDDPVLRVDLMVPRFAADLSIEPGDVHVLENASHFLQEDRPSDVAALITRFVKRDLPT